MRIQQRLAIGVFATPPGRRRRPRGL